MTTSRIEEFCRRWLVWDAMGAAPGAPMDITAAAPFLSRPLECFADPRVEMGTCMTCAQGGKTTVGIAGAAYALGCDPGPFMWVLPAIDEGKTFMQTRLGETLKRCKPIAWQWPKSRHDATSTEIRFPLSPLLMVGAGSGSKVSGKPIRWLFLDEEKNYPAGIVERAMQRVGAKWASKVWRMSTPLSTTRQGSSIYRAYIQGTQEQWHLLCPKCNQYHAVSFARMRFDPVAKGRKKLRDTIHYECPTDGCGHRWIDTPANRLEIATHGKWVASNPDAGPECVSFHWPAMLPPWRPWVTIVESFLEANALKKKGDDSAMEVWQQETLGWPVEDMGMPDVDELPWSDYDPQEYVGKLFPDEHIRVMTVDKQRDHFWYDVRGYKTNGASLLLEWGKTPTADALEQIRQRHDITPRHVMIDARYKPGDVYRECAKYGWIAIMGDNEMTNPRRMYAHDQIVYGQKKTVWRMYSRIQWVDFDGKRVPLIYLATDKLKDTLARLRAGEGTVWQVARCWAGSEYHDQMFGEVRKEIYDKKSKRSKWIWKMVGPNHLWDCEVYQVAASMMLGLHEPLTLKPDEDEPDLSGKTDTAESETAE